MQKYCLSQTGKVTEPKGKTSTKSKKKSYDMPLMEIIDVNRDGMNDLVFMDPYSQMLTVLYNQYKAQDYKAENLCADPTPGATLATKPFFTDKLPFKDSEESLLINLPKFFT